MMWWVLFGAIVLIAGGVLAYMRRKVSEIE
jgi:LPXTG-motif cell wall-anchored protein